MNRNGARNYDVGVDLTPEQWMGRAWRECETALVVTRGPSLEELPPHLRSHLPSARCLEAIVGYAALALVGRRAGLIGDGDFDLMIEQMVASLWSIRTPLEVSH